ncbi:hypothetical protein [Glycomyces tarimensis]
MVARSAVVIAGQIVEVFSLSRTASNPSAQHHLDAVGTAAGIGFTGRLDRLWSAVQP